MRFSPSSIAAALILWSTSYTSKAFHTNTWAVAAPSSSSYFSKSHLSLVPTDNIGDAAVYDAKTNSALSRYHKEYKRSIEQPDAFWREKALQYLHWDQPFQTVLSGSLEEANVRWFSGGKLNVCYNAIDRHVAAGKGNQLAMIWEGDEPDDIRKITYQQLLDKVSQIAAALTAQGVKKGDGE